ncbi:uncharacterized protein LOC141914181 [Tubulanus polymorphus]|uniref:uncharacterized protein LOC141914181 n=1 Tax=Tubulanus polymorphus TaxID=672921 RepID=UPI003DA40639
MYLSFFSARVMALFQSKFAKKQLEKHGWEEGSGLGKKEDGIKEAIKVTLKRDSAGVGHDAGAAFTFHWWDHVFNKTANSINVQNDKDAVTVSNDGAAVTMTTKKPSTARTYCDKSLLYGRFIKAATMTQEDSGTTVVREYSSESEDEVETLDKSTKLTDEELWKACGGRTAHKGARHGLKMNGKLNRVEQQERELLERLERKLSNVKTVAFNERVATKSYAIDGDVDKLRKIPQRRKIPVAEEDNDEDTTSSESEEDVKKKKKKSKKSRKENVTVANNDSSVGGNSNSDACAEAENTTIALKKKKKSKKTRRDSDCVNTVTNTNQATGKKRKLDGVGESAEESVSEADSSLKKKRKKSKKSNGEIPTGDLETSVLSNGDLETVVDDELKTETKKKKSKKSKSSKNENCSATKNSSSNCADDSVVVSGKKKKKSKKSKKKSD